MGDGVHPVSPGTRSEQGTGWVGRKLLALLKVIAFHISRKQANYGIHLQAATSHLLETSRPWAWNLRPSGRPASSRGTWGAGSHINEKLSFGKPQGCPHRVLAAARPHVEGPEAAGGGRQGTLLKHLQAQRLET